MKAKRFSAFSDRKDSASKLEERDKRVGHRGTYVSLQSLTFLWTACLTT